MDIILFLTLNRSQFICGAGKNVEGIGYDGTLYPCQRFIGDSKYAYGNINQTDGTNKFSSLINVDNFLAHDDNCQRCWVRNICGGYCYYLQCYGEYKKTENPMRCLLESIAIEEGIKCYIKSRNSNIKILNIYVS